MKNQQVSKNSPSFVPNSRAAKKAGKLSAEAALKIAKSQNRPVVFLSRGASSEFKKPETLPVNRDKTYKSSEAARMIGINVNTLQQHKQNGKISAEKVNGKLVYSGEEIERFKASRNQNS